MSGIMHSFDSLIYEIPSVVKFFIYIAFFYICIKTPLSYKFLLTIIGFLILNFFKNKTAWLVKNVLARLSTVRFPIWFFIIEKLVMPPSLKVDSDSKTDAKFLSVKLFSIRVSLFSWCGINKAIAPPKVSYVLMFIW